MSAGLRRGLRAGAEPTSNARGPRSRAHCAARRAQALSITGIQQERARGSLCVRSDLQLHRVTRPLPCRDLETADAADELLTTVDRQSIKYGGGVRIGEYDCYPCRDLGIAGGDRFPPRPDPPTPAPSSQPPQGLRLADNSQKHSNVNPDHRLIYALSSHLTGSGSWGDLLVFGCVSGQVRTVYLGQFGTPETETIRESSTQLRQNCNQRSGNI